MTPPGFRPLLRPKGQTPLKILDRPGTSHEIDNSGGNKASHTQDMHSSRNVAQGSPDITHIHTPEKKSIQSMTDKQKTSASQDRKPECSQTSTAITPSCDDSDTNLSQSQTTGLRDVAHSTGSPQITIINIMPPTPQQVGFPQVLFVLIIIVPTF